MSLTEYLNVKIHCDEALKEILIAELSALSFDSMLETEDSLEAYIHPDLFNKQELEAVLTRYEIEKFEYEKVKDRNWNEEWENNYDPIEIGKKVRIRATFHDPKPDFDYELVINPRMSFGTGHHSTTYLMIEQQLQIDHNDKRVLDAGCGTAILAIMAEKLGASEIVAYDNNSWSTENAPENVELNQCKNIEVLEGTILTISLSDQFDIILANINKNVLLEEMSQYIQFLKPGGTLVLSGFYEHDAEDLIQEAENNGLTRAELLTRNNWCSIQFKN